MKLVLWLLLLNIATFARAQILTQDYRSILPPVADPALQKIFADPDLFFYTSENLPPAFQTNDGFARVTRNGQFIQRGSDGNFREPWARAGGLTRTRGVTEIRFVLLPKDSEGRPWPIIYFNQELDVARDGGRLFKVWNFPVGTVVGEILLQRGPDRLLYVFEIRVRFRERDTWLAEVHRPYVDAQSLADGIKHLRPQWMNDSRLITAIERLESPMALKERTVDDGRLGDRDAGVFRVTAGVFPLSPTPADLVSELLLEATFERVDRPFKVGTNGVVCNCPETEQFYNIVPPAFDGFALGFTGESCMECHETVGAAQRRFESTWSGHVRGSDGIFSFRPFNLDGSPIREFVDAGITAEYTLATLSQFPSDLYTSIERLRHLK